MFCPRSKINEGDLKAECKLGNSCCSFLCESKHGPASLLTEEALVGTEILNLIPTEGFNGNIDL